MANKGHLTKTRTTPFAPEVLPPNNDYFKPGAFRTIKQKHYKRFRAPSWHRSSRPTANAHTSPLLAYPWWWAEARCPLPAPPASCRRSATETGARATAGQSHSGPGTRGLPHSWRPARPGAPVTSSPCDAITVRLRPFLWQPRCGLLQARPSGIGRNPRAFIEAGRIFPVHFPSLLYDDDFYCFLQVCCLISINFKITRSLFLTHPLLSAALTPVKI